MITCACACGKKHVWESLPLVGTQTMPWGEVLELRNCPCGSTLSIVLDEGDFDGWEP